MPPLRIVMYDSMTEGVQYLYMSRYSQLGIPISLKNDSLDRLHEAFLPA